MIQYDVNQSTNIKSLLDFKFYVIKHLNSIYNFENLTAGLHVKLTEHKMLHVKVPEILLHNMCFV